MTIKTLARHTLGDMELTYLQNQNGRAVLLLSPVGGAEIPLTERNVDALDNASLVHLHLQGDGLGMFSNSFKLSETLSALRYRGQTVQRDGERTVIETTEEAETGFGILHRVIWFAGEPGFTVETEFYNRTGHEVTLDYLTSASLDGLGLQSTGDGGKTLLFHRFKAGWCMEGLHQCDSLTTLGLERAWATSGESLRLGAIGSRPVREYHPYAALEDTENGTICGVYLAHNASWQIELTRRSQGLSLSAGLADADFGQWSCRIPDGGTFTAPQATVSVCRGSIAELSDRLLRLRHRAVDRLRDQDMDIVYNDFVTTWGKPTEEGMLRTAELLRRGRTKYLVMDAGWFPDELGIGDWEVDRRAFPDGLKAYADKVRTLGMVPGLWMEFECADSSSAAFGAEHDGDKLKWHGSTIAGRVINGRREKFFDFTDPAVIAYMEQRVIALLRDNGFGYLKIDYNASIGIGIDGEQSGGENLRRHMALVRDFIRRIHEEVPGIVIENCASGGCRLEPSMMDMTEMSSVSDTHEGYEAAVVAANLHYLTPPRQNQIWCTLHPEYADERLRYICSQGFLGRICWSGDLLGLDERQLAMLFAAEEFYAAVSGIIKHGRSIIYRTDPCSFSDPTGTQAVVRYADDGDEVLVTVHSFRDPQKLTVLLDGSYRIDRSLFSQPWATIDGDTLTILPQTAFDGDVIMLRQKD